MTNNPIIIISRGSSGTATLRHHCFCRLHPFLRGAWNNLLRRRRGLARKQRWGRQELGRCSIAHATSTRGRRHHHASRRSKTWRETSNNLPLFVVQVVVTPCSSAHPFLLIVRARARLFNLILVRVARRVAITFKSCNKFLKNTRTRGTRSYYPYGCYH